MQYTRRILFSDDILPDETLPDELDELFSQLEQLEPPPALVTRILSSISQLPISRQHMYWAELDKLVVRHEDYPPC